MDIDDAYAAFKLMRDDLESFSNEQLSEADTRCKIIDAMLIGILGWTEAEISREPHDRNGYVDYLLRSGARSIMVIEAKRNGKMLSATKQNAAGNYKLVGPVLNPVGPVFEQARRYCSDHSVGYSAITSGTEWISFIAVRTDGIPLAEQKAILFPSLDAIENEFPMFYELFSKTGVQSRLYHTYIQEAETGSVRRTEELSSVIPSSSRKLLRSSEMSRDLERTFTDFFGDMSGDKDPEMLVACFVETPESRAADEALEKIAKNLTNSIEPISSGANSELEGSIREAVESLRGEFVLLIGNKGAGKSTFTDRFFSLVLPREVKEKCLIVRIDLRGWEGEDTSIQAWLNAELKSQVERGLFGKKTPAYEDLQGAFYDEYNRWRHGEHKYLYQDNKVSFKQKFGDYMADFARDEPFKYSLKLMKRSIDSSKRMPCLIFDNADHYSQLIQEQVFQYAQAINRTIFSFVVLPITDHTVWQLGKSGPLQSYQTRSFYLPIPSTKDVIRRRLAFVQQKLSSKDSASYFLGRSMKLSIKDFSAFASCLEGIFIDEDYTSRTVAWLANHDIRRSLEITRGVFTSPWLKIEDLFKTYVVGDRLSVPKLSVYKALILGSYDRFMPERSSFILNIFSVRPDYLSSPLLKLSLLRYLTDADGRQGGVEHKYASVSEIENYMEILGSPYAVTRSHLEELVQRRLVEPYDPTVVEITEDQRLRITHSGKLHSELALSNQHYILEMAVTTDIRYGQKLDTLRAALSSANRGKMTGQDWRNMCITFVDYCLEEDKLFLAIPEIPAYQSQRDMRAEWRSRWAPEHQIQYN